MAIDDFVSFSEFLGANKDTLERIEREMEQRRLALQSESDAATESLRNQAVDSAYWGGSGDIGSYSDYQKAVESADAAEMFRKNLQSDAGQAEALRQRYGAATGMDALLFGDRSEASLGEFLGNKGIDSVRDETREAREDYNKEAQLQRESEMAWSDWNRADKQYRDAEEEYYNRARRDMLESYSKQPNKWVDRGFYEYLQGGQDPTGDYRKRLVQDYVGGGGQTLSSFAGTQGIFHPGAQPEWYRGRLSERPRKTSGGQALVGGKW